MVGAITAVGAGFGAGAGMHALESSLRSDVVPAQEMVNKCAPHLGDAAVKSSSLPEGCEDAAGYIPYRANVEEDVNYQQRPSLYYPGVTRVSEDRVYELPSRSQFEVKMQRFIDQDKNTDSFSYKVNVGAVALFSTLFGWYGYTVSGYKRKKKTDDSSDETGFLNEQVAEEES